MPLLRSASTFWRRQHHKVCNAALKRERNGARSVSRLPKHLYCQYRSIEGWLSEKHTFLESKSGYGTCIARWNLSTVWFKSIRKNKSVREERSWNLMSSFPRDSHRCLAEMLTLGGVVTPHVCYANFSSITLVNGRPCVNAEILNWAERLVGENGLLFEECSFHNCCGFLLTLYTVASLGVQTMAMPLKSTMLQYQIPAGTNPNPNLLDLFSSHLTG